MNLYGPLRDKARMYLKAIPHTNGVPTQGEVDELTRLLTNVRDDARAEVAKHVGPRIRDYRSAVERVRAVVNGETE